jgi:hypothetical protein
MTLLSKASEIARSPGDPKIIETGPSSRGISDQLAVGLGWFSIALGVTQLLATRQLTRSLGLEGREGLMRAFGVRELFSGLLSLSADKQAGIWTRVAGDGLDIATLVSAHNDNNPKKRNVGLALSAVTGVTLLDLACAQGLTSRHGRGPSAIRDYSDRSGFPRGVEASKGAARDFRPPPDMRAAPQAPPFHPERDRQSHTTVH